MISTGSRMMSGGGGGCGPGYVQVIKTTDSGIGVD